MKAMREFRGRGSVKFVMGNKREIGVSRVQNILG